ncbi:hypothetical protein DER46DRAFT_579537 [Fusarium sp. MPI-SDFR-AT-0072]|nr:hypothetical protein DER46DRAFT_579537 [Fusarium sp. MPI-SDFR-AT-0072]
MKLDSCRADTFPGLPGHATSAAAGCAFYKALRHDLMASWEFIEEKEGEEEKGVFSEQEENEIDAEGEGKDARNEICNGDNNVDGDEEEAGDDDSQDDEGACSNEDATKSRYGDIDTDTDAESKPNTEPDEQSDDTNVKAEDSDDKGQ